MVPTSVEAIPGPAQMREHSVGVDYQGTELAPGEPADVQTPARYGSVPHAAVRA